MSWMVRPVTPLPAAVAKSRAPADVVSVIAPASPVAPALNVCVPVPSDRVAVVPWLSPADTTVGAAPAGVVPPEPEDPVPVPVPVPVPPPVPVLVPVPVPVPVPEDVSIRRSGPARRR